MIEFVKCETCSTYTATPDRAACDQIRAGTLCSSCKVEHDEMGCVAFWDRFEAFGPAERVAEGHI